MRILLTAVSCLSLVACSESAPTQESDAPIQGVATQYTQRANAEVKDRLPLGDTTDFDNASRGLLAQIEGEIRTKDGRLVWDPKAYDFIEGQSPDTVNPSLWRQSRLAAMHGLFEVQDGIYQIRGYDLSVMTLIRGDTGWIIVDPLLSSETAAAGLKLANDTLGERPVTGVLYTHSHADHFGGVRGILDEDGALARKVPILAPEGFLKSSVVENLLAGNHMSRRAVLMFGSTLTRSTDGHVGSGLGPALSAGTIGLIPPTEEIAGNGQQRTIDGVIFEFADANETEAPSEFMFYLPQFKALCTAEVATGTFHNALTMRGAKVRDLLKWSQSIDYVLNQYGARSNVVFASHHWPKWGAENVEAFLKGQRDIYRYTHDQTLKQANAGATITEVGNSIEEPGFTKKAFDTRGYYGTLNHNAKAVYQHYFGWWSGVPAEFNPYPAEEHAKRFVKLAGGASETLSKGREAYGQGDYRWSAEVLNNLVFFDPANEQARLWLAASYEQLGFQSESGTWRSYYLAGASELRSGLPNIGKVNFANPDFISAVPTRDMFDAFAVRYDAKKLGRAPFSLNFKFTDTKEDLLVEVGADTTYPRMGDQADDAAATIILTRAALDQLVLKSKSMKDLMKSGELKIEGDPSAVGAYFGALVAPPFWFNVVTP